MNKSHAPDSLLPWRTGERRCATDESIEGCEHLIPPEPSRVEEFQVNPGHP